MNVQWVAELKKCVRSAHFMLVGLQKDLRNDPTTNEELHRYSQHPVTPEEGWEVAKKIGAITYMECSAKTGEGLMEVFEMLAKCSLVIPALHDARETKKKWWSRRST